MAQRAVLAEYGSVFSIGEFFQDHRAAESKRCSFYHEKGILVPGPPWTEETGYRYYEPRQIDTARIITQPPQPGISRWSKIGAQLLENFDDEADILVHLERQ